MSLSVRHCSFGVRPYTIILRTSSDSEICQDLLQHKPSWITIIPSFTVPHTVDVHREVKQWTSIIDNQTDEETFFIC